MYIERQLLWDCHDWARSQEEREGLTEHERPFYVALVSDLYQGFYDVDQDGVENIQRRDALHEEWVKLYDLAESIRERETQKKQSV